MEKNQNKKHGLMMLICCLVPILLLLALPLFGFSRSLGRFPILLLFVVSHIVVMKFMMKGNGHSSCHGGHNKKEVESKEEKNLKEM